MDLSIAYPNRQYYRCDKTPHQPHRLHQPHRQQFLPHRHQITAPAPKTTTSCMAAAADDWRCLRVRVSGRFRRRCGNFLPVWSVQSMRPVRCFITPLPAKIRCRTNTGDSDCTVSSQVSSSHDTWCIVAPQYIVTSVILVLSPLVSIYLPTYRRYRPTLPEMCRSSNSEFMSVCGFCFASATVCNLALRAAKLVWKP